MPTSASAPNEVNLLKFNPTSISGAKCTSINRLIGVGFQLTPRKIGKIKTMYRKREIVDIKGNKKKIGCLGCAIQKGKLDNGIFIAETKFFTASQDYEIPIAGFVILAAKRHLQSLDEFTAEERFDFIEFLTRLRMMMRQVLDTQTVYLIQEEDTSHHFHVWIFPRYAWMAEKFGRKIESVRPIMEYARENLKTKENLKKVDEAIAKMRNYFPTSIKR